MKRNQYISKTTACPFYKKEDRQTIFCCGVEENSSIHLAFGYDAACKKYKTDHCRGDYQRCQVYRMLEDMYYG